LPGFAFVNKCAYFDHQRDKVFARTNRRIKGLKSRRKPRRKAVRIDKVVELPCERCPACNARRLYQIGGVSQLIIDLRYSRSGVRKWVVKYLSWEYSCSRCGGIFTHPEFPRVTTKYGRGLVSWCVYQNVACGQIMLRVRKVLAEVFNLSLRAAQLYRFKTAVAEHYRPRYALILMNLTLKIGKGQGA
jgi:hypothetical protein